MASVLAIGNILRIRFTAMEDGQLGEFRMHYVVGNSPVPSATDLDVATYLDSVIAADLKGLMSDKATYWGVGVQKMNPLPLYPEVKADAGAGTGTTGSASLPKQVSGLVTWYTPFAGRKGRGRSYLPFPSVEYNGSRGAPSLAYIENVNTIAILLGGPIAVTEGGRSCSITPVLWHRRTLIYDNIIGYRVNQNWATQRRRGDLGRPNAPPW